MTSNHLKLRLESRFERKLSVKYVFFVLFILLKINVYGQVEICNNNRDDDGDGFIDCADPDCGCSANTFPCDSKMYMVRANPSDNNATNIEELTISGSVPTLNTLFTKPFILNGLAYFNGYIYVMSSAADTLYRLDKLGNIVNLGKVANLPIPVTQWSGATCDRDGNMYIIEGVNPPNFRMYKIPLLPGGTYTATQIVGTGAGGAIAIPNNPADIAIDENGVMYAFIQANLSTSTTSSGLYTINLTNGTPTKVGSLAFSGISMGSLFASDDGRMYAYGCNNQTTAFNQNTFYEVDKGTSAVTALTSTGTAVGRSDGCSCPWRVTLQRASPTVCTYPNGYFNWDFTLRNQTGAVLNNINFRDTLDSRFSYNFNVATTQTAFQAIYGAGVTITVSSFGGGTNNVVSIAGMNVPLNVTTFSLNTYIPATSVFTTNEIVYQQAYLKNLPSFRGTFESSDYPATTGPNNDASPVTIKVSQVRITAGTNQTICTGQTVSFTAANAGNGASYAWDFGIGSSPSTSSLIGPIVVTYNTAGTQTVTLSVTSNGCTGVITTPVTVNSTPSVSTLINQTICTGGTAILTVSASGGSGTTTYQWQESTNNTTWANVSGGSGATTLSYTTPVLTANKYYRIIATSSPSTCSSTSASALITVVADPTITVATTAAIICTGGGTSFTATANGGTGSCVIQWQSSPNGTTWTDISGETNTTFVTPSLSATYRYRAKITCSGSGCCN
jgi:PKD repeat protein